MMTPAEIKKFVSSDGAVFTLTSRKTGVSFRYRVDATTAIHPLPVLGVRHVFVELPVGRGPSGIWTQCGVLFDERFFANARSSESLPEIRAFNYFAEKVLFGGVMPDSLVFERDSLCGRPELQKQVVWP